MGFPQRCANPYLARDFMEEARFKDSPGGAFEGAAAPLEDGDSATLHPVLGTYESPYMANSSTRQTINPPSREINA